LPEFCATLDTFSEPVRIGQFENLPTERRLEAVRRVEKRSNGLSHPGEQLVIGFTERALLATRDESTLALD
jgi:hypothetical protein